MLSRHKGYLAGVYFKLKKTKVKAAMSPKTLLGPVYTNLDYSTEYLFPPTITSSLGGWEDFT